MTAHKLQGKRTKIVATIGPASYDEERLREMIRAGVNVARINFSHGDYETHAKAIAMVRRLGEEEGVTIAVLADLQGPKLRLGRFAAIRLVRGDTLTLTSREPFDITRREVPLPHPELIRDVQAGQRLLLDDGEIELVVREKPNSTDLLCEVINGNELKERKGVSAPDSRLTLPAITQKDREDVKFALEQDVDWVAMSFVRRKEDVERLRWLIEELGYVDVPIIAKIEKPEALDNIEEIVSVSDGIMVARGDLGVETSAAEVPIHQKRIIRLCNQSGKPVITATQMLDSMIRNPRPTRAEASDVANAIFDGTDAVMLSGESASGDYPLEAVEMMATIAQIAEKQLHEQSNYRHRIQTSLIDIIDSGTLGKDSPTADAVSHATVEMADRVGAALIVCSTWTGYTARRVARERPLTPIICVTPNPKAYRRLSLVWGVQALIVPQYHSIDEMFQVIEEALAKTDWVEPGDRVVIISGVPFGAAGATNFVKIHEIR